ncbi:MAG: TolC family protein [Candidatus Kapabacteria bacterium]|nr:TolC family protein [Candidatus Kapabacteria bacterium]
MKRLVILLMSVFFKLVSISNGQLSIDYCQSRALENYPLIRQYKLIEQTSELNVSNAGKSYLPQLSLSARASYQSDITAIPPELGSALSQMTGRDVRFDPVNKDQYQIIAELSQIIWDGGNVRAQKELIKSTGETDSKVLEVELYSIKERVNSLFFGILLLEANKKQVESVQDELNLQISNIESYIANGIANQSDLDLIRAEKLKSLQRFEEINSEIEAYREMLFLMTNDPKVLDSELSAPVYDKYNNDYQVINRPELGLFEAQRNLQTNREKLLHSYNMPKIGLFLRGAYGNPGLNMLEAGFTPYYIFGLRLDWNLSGFYSFDNNLELIEINKKNIELREETFVYNTKLKITKIRRNINKLEEQLKNDEEIISLRKKLKEYGEVKLQNGTSNYNELLRLIISQNNAELEMKQRQVELLMSIYNLKNIVNY